MPRPKAAPKNKTYDSELWYAVFVTLGATRTLPAVRRYGESVGVKVPSLKSLQKWSAEKNWYERAREFEVGVAERTIELTGDSVAERDARHAGFMRRAIDALDWNLVKLATMPEADREVHDLPTVIDSGAKAIDKERIATGAATSRVEVAHSFAKQFLPEVLRIFISINMLPDSEQREDQMIEELNGLTRRLITA